MGRSSISLGSFEYLLSLMQTSPFPLWKASASLTQDTPFTHGRHPLAQFPLPSTKITYFRRPLSDTVRLRYVNAEFVRQKFHDIGA